MSMLDEIAGQAERESLLNQRTGVIRLESAGAEKYLKFYKIAIIPASIFSLFIPVFALPVSIWAEECAGLHADAKGLQFFGLKYKSPARMYLAYSLIGRRGLAGMLPALLAVTGWMIGGLLDLLHVTGGATELLIAGECWAAGNTWYVFKKYGQAKRAALAAQGAADYMQQGGK